MTTSMGDILSLQSLDLTPFEIRGAKSGINNASTTGLVYVDGQYIPAKSAVTGDGSFSSPDSTVRDFSFDSPYGSLTTSSLKIGDSLTADSTAFTIANIDTTSSFQLSMNAGFTGIYPISFNLDQREYIVEPDITRNTITTGIASFVQGNTDVTGSGTTWLSLAARDFIKHDGYQEYFEIEEVLSAEALRLVSPYPGDTTSGAYTAKRWVIGRTKVQYAKNNITYDNQSAKWRYDAIIGNDVTTSVSFRPLTDGIELAFTRSLTSIAPDLMDSWVVINKVFSRETQYETFQFSLPVVPNPESSMELFINDIKKDMFQDYVLNYTQSPVYTPPPSPDQRFVANIMFLEGIANIQPSSAQTESGQMSITDDEGNIIAGIFPGSESIIVDTVPQIPLRDYMLEPNTGTLEIIDTVIDEQIVKYIGASYSDYIDYGFTVKLNGKKQKISFPAETDDDILFQPYSGRLKPRSQGHPGPGEIYEVSYMVETDPISDELIVPSEGQTVIETNFYPIKQDSIFLIKNKDILDEGTDFFVSYLTGKITLITPATSTDLFKINYTPLSKQVNLLTYESGFSYCTVNDSRLTVKEASNFKFGLVNTLLDTEDITVLRIYNEARDKDYDLTNILTEGKEIVLEKNAINISIGLDPTDIVLIDYKFKSDTTEYFPVVINYFNLLEGIETVYVEGADITSFINSNAIITLVRPDSPTQYFFTIVSASYDNFGTKINLKTAIPEDITNPGVFITDDAVSFLTVPVTADPIVVESTTISFPGANIRNIFRKGIVLKIKDDLYQVSNAVYVGSPIQTLVTLNSEALYDYTDTADLSDIKYSDCPVYLEGETEITPVMPAVTLFNQPGFIMNNESDEILTVTSDSSKLTIETSTDSTSFPYLQHTTLGDVSSAINISNISALALTSYALQWQSNKIISLSDPLSVYRDSSTILPVSDAVRYKDIDATVFSDSSNFSVNNVGSVILTNELQKGDRYRFDYLGREFLGDKQVEYSVQYFTSLPAKSKVSASFQYNNLDQFYIQTLDQRDFFEIVTIPRMKEEAKQLSGSVGQGGEIAGDTGEGNAEGGLAGDEYRRQDTDIECRVFKNIYDFFQSRLVAFSNEMEAALGPRVFNNDGTFSEDLQEAAFKVVSRIFPETDYTNFEPMRVNPLTGYFFDDGAKFINGSTDVTGVSTLWTKQLDSSGFIGSTDTTRRYEISTVSDDTNLSLTIPFEENSSGSDGEPYTATNKSFPLYDDDGFLGAKIIGAKNRNFNLLSGDVFDIYLDGTTAEYKKDYTFSAPSNPFLALMYPPSTMSAETVAQLLTSGISGLKCTSERIIDPSAAYGYSSKLVLRSDSTVNFMQLGDNTTVRKLGFTPGETAYGNLDRTDYSIPSTSLFLFPPEIILDGTEASHIISEIGYLNTVISAGIPDKLNRLTSLANVNDASTQIANELITLYKEIPKIETEISATGHIIEEPPPYPSYADTSQAHLNATLMLADTSVAIAYANDIIPSWQGKGINWKWALDFTEHSQFIRGIDSTGVGVDQSSGLGITPIEGQTSFILEAPSGNDRRILDATIYSTYYTPKIVGESPLIGAIDGSWTGWEGSYDYSVNNQITFHLDTPSVITLTDMTTTVNNLRYVTDATAMNLLWEITGDTSQEVYTYVDYPLVSDMRSVLNSSAVVDATSNPAYDSKYCRAFIPTTQLINPDATVYPGLRDATVAYQTISDKLLTDKITFSTDRSNFLLNRINYLDSRKTQIENDIFVEKILHDGGVPGDLYVWANNRFNRRQGCYARLKQIEQQIISNKSALLINKSFI